jgi:hypothetical protein
MLQVTHRIRNGQEHDTNQREQDYNLRFPYMENFS